jgi:ABC-type lipoprotein release transport system permease subunit
VAPVWVANNVLVGSQKQVVYGVEPDPLARATIIEDRFFVNGTAQSALDHLRTTPDGLLVSNEFADAYSIEVGDTVAMRIPNTDGSYFSQKFHVLAMFTIFPTSSQNSDLVVNSALLVGATGNPNPGFFLLRTDGTSQANDTAASTLKQKFNDRLAVRIETANQAVSLDQSSLVGVNLAGLASLERLYSALIIGLALGVFLVGSIIERRRELGTLEALGTTVDQVTWLLLMEGALLAASGVVGGALVGVLLAWQYNGFLPGIFSVPIPVLNVPVSELGLLVVLSFVGVAAAALLASVRLRQLWPAEVLRDM